MMQKMRLSKRSGWRPCERHQSAAERIFEDSLSHCLDAANTSVDRSLKKPVMEVKLTFPGKTHDPRELCSREQDEGGIIRKVPTP